MQEYVSLPAAAKDAGVPVRTLRYWITSGKLSAKRGKRGYLVRLADVQHVAAVIRPVVRPGASSDETPPYADTPVQEQTIIPVTARAQLAAVMDEWVLPLMDRIAALERENGQLEERLAAAIRERDAAIAASSQPRSPEPSPTPSQNDMTALQQIKPRSFWKRFFGLE